MKALTIRELPDDNYFWRNGFPFKWIKVDNQLISAVADVPKELEWVKPDLREIVLSDPSWCAECGSETGKWPPTGPCPKCGSTSTPSNFEEVKKIIEDWIGHSNPHI